MTTSSPWPAALTPSYIELTSWAKLSYTTYAGKHFREGDILDFCSHQDNVYRLEVKQHATSGAQYLNTSALDLYHLIIFNA